MTDSFSRRNPEGTVRFRRWLLAPLIHLINHRMDQLPTVQEINDKIATLTQKVQANTDATSSVQVFVQGLKDQLTQVQQQLADAIAQNDPAALQGASDALDAVIQSVDADTVAEAAITNTDAAPTT